MGKQSLVKNIHNFPSSKSLPVYKRRGFHESPWNLETEKPPVLFQKIFWVFIFKMQ